LGAATIALLRFDFCLLHKPRNISTFFNLISALTYILNVFNDFKSTYRAKTQKYADLIKYKKKQESLGFRRC